ncbi:hypothetical protein BH09VER1_BH09VER1_47580 [soil metagenome]
MPGLSHFAGLPASGTYEAHSQSKSGKLSERNICGTFSGAFGVLFAYQRLNLHSHAGSDANQVVVGRQSID